MGFTLVELVVVAAVLVLLSAASYPLLLRSYEEQKLHQAAIELQTWLVRARSLAQRNHGPCAVRAGSIANSLASDSSVAGNVCSGSSLAPVHLDALTGVRGLCLSNSGVMQATCVAPAALQFNHLGLLVGPPQLLLLSGSRTSAQVCVDLTLTLIRVGHRPSPGVSCSFRDS